MENNVWNILKKELKELFRDKKSLTMMLIIPIFIPLMVLGMSALFEAQMSKDVSEYNQIGVTYEISEAEKNIAQEMKLEFIYGTEEQLQEKYEQEEIDLYITKQENQYTIYTNGSENSNYAKSFVETYLNTYKQYLQEEYLRAHEINPAEVFNPITVEEKVIEEKENDFFANYVKNYAFLFIMMAITVSATYPSTDTTAGEKERGTLETLLTFPIKAKDIIVGKFLSVSISSMITGVISFILAIVSLMIAQNNFSIYEEANTMYNAPSIVVGLLIIMAYSIFISGLCISIASTSKTFKEAQSALTPLTFISFFPGMIAFMIDVSATPLLSMIPFLNYTIIFTDITKGNLNYLNLALMFVTTCVYISIVLYWIIKQYKSEKILFSK